MKKSERLRVAVLMGGPSSEHEVSLSGGRTVVESLDRTLFEVLPVVITREGRWRLSVRGYDGPGRGSDGDGGFDPRREDGWKDCDGVLEALSRLRRLRTDVAMPVLHGRFGEDGTLQACLAAAGIPFVGSGSQASAVAVDKVRTKEVLAYHGIPSPRFRVIEPEEARRGRADTARRILDEFGSPVVLKDPTGGSSLEVRICDTDMEAASALEELSRGGGRLMAEAYVRGRELTAGVLEDREKGEAVALPLVEIRPRKSRTFDYREKYSPDGAEELCPAPVSAAVEEEGRSLGLRVHRLLGLRGISRTDLMLDESGSLTVLEVNTLPGMTPTSLVPRAARAAGLSFGDLLEKLVRSAWLP